jgi:hypothetical protein
MLPVETFCDNTRRVIDDDLTAIGLSHVHDHRFRNDYRDDHAVCLYNGNDYLVAISWSIDDGVVCTMSADQSADVSGYASWINLWEWANAHASDEWKQRFDKVFEPIPAKHDEVLVLTLAALREFFDQRNYSNSTMT